MENNPQEEIEDNELHEELPLLNPTRPSRNSTLKTKFIGGFLAILACFIFTWVAYFVQTFGENVSDIMFVRSVLQIVVFAMVIKYWKLDFWLCRNHFESKNKYWLHCALLIFQVSKVKVFHNNGLASQCGKTRNFPSSRIILPNYFFSTFFVV